MKQELKQNMEMEMIPEIKLQCPNCKANFNIEALHRIYRAYLTLTRTSRKTSYNVVCSKCGKHTQVRILPDNSYKCKHCLSVEEQDVRRGYKKNPLANKRIE